ncbi:MAG: hypothetical protein HY938_08690 [Nitrosomonadales bacterium]|nr:hypothetical protein [Nitrosomonadales bacterium]
MEALNFSTHAIEGLQESATHFMPGMPKTARNILRIADLLKQAIKFRLPDNGDLFEDALRALPAIFRLPYPIVAAEFRVTTDQLGQGPLAVRGENLDRSSKRIALAIEINTDNFDAYSWMLPQSKYDLLTLDGAIAIIPVFYIDAKQHWAIPPLGIAILSKKIDSTPALLERTKEIYGGDIPKGTKQLPLEMHTMDLMPEYAHELEIEQGVSHVMATAQQDTHDESRAIMGLIEILSCNNVRTETIPAPKALNKKRTAKGKTPLYEFKVLTLDFQDVHAVKTTSSQNTHASPRIHLRRGHIRRLENKTIWVNAAVVGNRKLGIVTKDYSVNPL